MKDIKQIQEYNRRKIIKLCNPEFDPERFQYPAYVLTLSKVLIALRPTDSTLKYAIDSDGQISSGFCGNTYHYHCQWDLTKQTLEDQDFETQFGVFKLLGGE